MVLALFLTEKPRTHVYTFFIPWLLLAGRWRQRAVAGCARASARARPWSWAAPPRRSLILLFGTYAFRYLRQHATR